MAGFVLLIKGADIFVEGSSSIAKILKIPSVIIGLTIVSIGTSLPEAAVSITAGLAGSSDMALGNIIGSNMFNLLVVIGASAVFLPIVPPKEILRRDMLWNISMTAVLFLFIFNKKISRIEGAVLLAALLVYLVLLIKNALKSRTEEDVTEKRSVPKSLLFIIIGVAAIILGGNLVVNNASLIAKSLGMSDALVALTIVAIGTSLPELVTSIVAAKKGESGIALGNAVGSCLFNIMFILGASSLLTPINAANELLIDTGILIAVCILMFLFISTGKKITRLEGAFCLLLYAAYSAYIIIR